MNLNFIDFIVTQAGGSPRAEALVWRGSTWTYGELLKVYAKWLEILKQNQVSAGAVVGLEADFSPESVGAFLALTANNCVLVPLSHSVAAKNPHFSDIAEIEYSIRIEGDDSHRIEKSSRTATHTHYRTLRERAHPGLVLFSSGSTGTAKAAVHDLTGILEKFKVPRARQRAITFLLFDHIGGVNTLFYMLSNLGCVVTVEERSPDVICRAIQDYRVELLPTSPTFLNLLLLSEAWTRYDLSSLKTITYGTEPMLQSTLERVHKALPRVQLLQTYGLSEVGILRSKSKGPDSLWVKIGGEGFETRVIQGLLEIKAKSAMLGYLNAPSPFTEDGWFKTGDAVDVDGEYFRILGRKSELINVGGEKVYPAEVESVVQEMLEVQDVSVVGVPHPITGNVVCAKVTPVDIDADAVELSKKIRAYCRTRLAAYKIPVKIEVIREAQHNDRFKKMRRATP